MRGQVKEPFEDLLVLGFKVKVALFLWDLTWEIRGWRRVDDWKIFCCRCLECKMGIFLQSLTWEISS